MVHNPFLLARRDGGIKSTQLETICVTRLSFLSAHQSFRQLSYEDSTSHHSHHF